MSRLSKAALLGRVEAGFRESGMFYERLSQPGEHPARYRAYGEEPYALQVYVWNTSPGGHGRPEDEYRIQVTGVDAIEVNAESTTLILGWSSQLRVFSAWDAARHVGPVSSSPSKQVKEDTLLEADRHGISACYRGGGEVTVGFRADFFEVYLLNMDALHRGDLDEEQIESLTRAVIEAGESTAPLPHPPESRTTEPTERALEQVTRSVRDASFRRRVLAAYGHRCAACGIQLDLVEAAHILPVRHEYSTDETTKRYSRKLLMEGGERILRGLSFSFP